MSEEERELCIKFLQNPKINPKTGGRLIEGKGPYREFVELCLKHKLILGEGPVGFLYALDQVTSFPAPLKCAPEMKIYYKNKIIYSNNPIKPLLKKPIFIDKNNIDTIDYFLNFPDDIIIEIFKHVHVNSCISMLLSSKKFYDLMRSDHLWKYKYLANFPNGLSIKEKSYYDIYRLSVFLNKYNYRFTLNELYQQKTYKQEYVDSNIFPIELFQLTHLQHLTYSANFITEIPHQISKLNKLVYLDLSANKISTISPEIEKLIYLKCLNLSCNELTEIPLSICKLYNLVALVLKNNFITAIPAELKKLVNLKIVEIDKGVIIPKELHKRNFRIEFV